MRRKRIHTHTLLVTFGTGLATSVQAHAPDALATAAGGGALHVFGGLDHLLALLAVGLLAARWNGPMLVALPAVFIAALTAGFAIALLGLPLSSYELSVTGSVIAFGLLLAAGRQLAPGLLAAAVGSLALVHGYAHGFELAATATAAFLVGLLLASGALLLGGIAAGRLAAALTPRVWRLAAGALVGIGALLSTGAL